MEKIQREQLKARDILVLSQPAKYGVRQLRSLFKSESPRLGRRSSPTAGHSEKKNWHDTERKDQDREMGCKPSTEKDLQMDCWGEDWFKMFKKEESSVFGGFKNIVEDDRRRNSLGLGVASASTSASASYASGGRQVPVSRIALLDDYEKELLRYSWSMLTRKNKNLGKQVFLRIFELRPSAKGMFPFKNASSDNLTKHPLFSAHGKRFIRVIACVVERLDSLEECHTPLINLGIMHLKIKGFLPDYFDVFTRAIIDVWRAELREQYLEDMDGAWQKVLDFIVMRLKEGYEAEKMRAAYFVE